MGGGKNNYASAEFATIGGGVLNDCSGIGGVAWASAPS